MQSEQLELWKGLFKLEVRGVKQDLIPYVRQLELPKAPVKGWIIDPNVLNGTCHVVWLPTHNGDVFFHPGMLTCDVGMVTDGGRSPEISSCFSPKVLVDSPMYSSSHSNLSHLYLYINPLFSVMDVILVLGSTRKLLMVLHPLKWNWTPILLQMFLKLSLKPSV